MNNHRNFIFLSCIFFIFQFFSYSFSEINKSEIPDAERKIRLTWEQVEGAVGYKVMLKNPKGEVIINKDTDSNSIVLELPYGDYKIRIGSINKFERIGSWSDWADISIKKPEVKQEKPVKAPVKTEIFDLGLKIGAGMSYFYIMPNWDEYYENSFKGITLNATYSLRHIGFSGILGILRFTGFDIDCTYIKFKGIKAFNRVESNLTDIITGGDIFLSTNFTFPINFFIRGGGGLVHTSQEYQKYNNLGDPVDKGTSGTFDFFYKAGLSIEYRFYSYFFLEAYADYYSINYLIKDFNALKLSCLAGVRF